MESMQCFLIGLIIGIVITLVAISVVFESIGLKLCAP